jgi:hypothetical protein
MAQKKLATDPTTDGAKQVPARPYDSGSQANETVDRLDATTLLHAAEDTPDRVRPDDTEKTPVFEPGGRAPQNLRVAMAKNQQSQIVETPAEARQAEPGPSVLSLLTVSTGLGVFIPAWSGLCFSIPD